MKLTYIKQLLKSTIRHSRIKNNFTFISRDLFDHQRHLTNGNILTRSDIHKLRIIIMLHQEKTGCCKVITVQEFTAWSTCTPDSNGRFIVHLRLMKLAQQG